MKATEIKEPREQPRRNQPRELPSEKQQRDKELGDAGDKPADNGERHDTAPVPHTV